ncbi:MAG: hypothetical protein HPY90_14955 [Syntrophothermus sp.]|uniref:hypothetical protein n=1 Tax=Syntrophothermus sp. TaxID=2736299 RepID=UPI00257D6067|nr:hypothetical protein [Syntrophothermus sp.]NSW84510.1 hypothetical protein [Syntrophothermus sp.]
MHRVALEKVYLERKLAQNAWRARVIEKLQGDVTLLLREGGTYEQYREEYVSFAGQKRNALVSLLNGVTPDLVELSSGGGEQFGKEGPWKLRLVLGGLFHFACLRTREALVELAAVFCLLELPYVALRVVLQAQPQLLKLVQDSLAECLNNGLPFSYKLSLKTEARGTFEERALREYEEGLREEDLSKVSCLMKALRHQRMDYLHGPYAVILALVYYCDRALFARLVAAAATPAFINLICQDPEFAFDLELLWKIAEHGGLWARVEVFHHLVDLLRACREVRLVPAEKKEAALARAFRRLIAVYLGRVLILLVATKKPGLLGYILDTVSAVYLNPGDRFSLYFLGKYVGRSISLYLSEAALEQELAGWEPCRSAWGLMYLLYGAQAALEKRSVELLCALNRVLLRKWLALVWKAYRDSAEHDASLLPFTALDLAVGNALAQRWKTRKNSVRFLKGLCRRLQAVEGIWLESSEAEERKKRALYAGILAHARAWALLPPDEVVGPAVPAIDFVRGYIADRRNWERVPGRDNKLEMPSYFMEIQKAYGLGL